MSEILAELNDVRLLDYFEPVSRDEIRIRGTRVGIETVIQESQQGLSAGEIAAQYPALLLEQIHATLTLYHHHSDEIDAYMRRWARHGEEMLAQQRKQDGGFVSRLREAVHPGGDAWRFMINRDGRDSFLT